MERTLRLKHAVRVFPADEVTSQNPNEEEAHAGGLSPGDVESIWRGVVQLYETGLHPALALSVRRHGHVVLDRAIGHIRGNAPADSPRAPVRPARYDSLFSLYSASKVVTAMLIHHLVERRLVGLDDRVVKFIPEFGRHGKSSITVRDLFLHRAGIPFLPAEHSDIASLCDHDRALALVCDAKPVYPPRKRVAYHALTTGVLFAEIAKQTTGSDLRELLAKQVRTPLGFQSLDYGVPEALMGQVAENAFTGVPPFAPFSWALTRSLGVGVQEAVAASNDPRFLRAIVPSGNVIGTAEEGSRFMQLLLDGGELGGVRVFDPDTVKNAIAEESAFAFDGVLGLPVRYGLGFMLGGESFSPYGKDTGRAFGHIGFTNVVAHADPERDIAVCLMSSGKPFITPGQFKWLGLMRLIAAQCGKTGRRR